MQDATPQPASVSPIRRRSRARTVLPGLLLLVLVGLSLWLVISLRTSLEGRWENDERFLIFVGDELMVLSKDCTGWPHEQQGNARLRVAGRPGLPGRLELQDSAAGLQALQLFYVLRPWLIVSADGLLPAGIYRYAGSNTFIIGICGLEDSPPR